MAKSYDQNIGFLPGAILKKLYSIYICIHVGSVLVSFVWPTVFLLLFRLPGPARHRASKQAIQRHIWIIYGTIYGTIYGNIYGTVYGTIYILCCFLRVAPANKNDVQVITFRHELVSKRNFDDQKAFYQISYSRQVSELIFLKTKPQYCEKRKILTILEVFLKKT